MPLLSFVSDEKYLAAVKEVLDIAQHAADEAEDNLFSNKVDPFSAIFDSMRQNISLEKWLTQESARQVQKTMQNALGNFHQRIIGSIDGWENLAVGSVIDVRNMKKRVIAEIKNKYNTTKGSDKKAIYDNLDSQLRQMYHGFTGYYVEIIPQGSEPYDEPFTPSDNTTHKQRPRNEHIRIIDGKSFYAMASGKGDAINELYRSLPIAIGKILQLDHERLVDEELFRRLFERAY